MSILFLGANMIPGISKGTILGMNVFTYVILMIIPSAVILNSLFSEFTTLKLALLGLLLGFSVFDLITKSGTAIEPYGDPLLSNKGCAKAFVDPKLCYVVLARAPKSGKRFLF